MMQTGENLILEDTTALVVGGGVGCERQVSIDGAGAVAAALMRGGRCRVEHRIIDRISLDALRAMPGDVIVPILHGAWGEGGSMQDLLVADGRPFVGSGPRAARLAMDKIAMKLIAQRRGVRTSVAAILDPDDPVCPLHLPVVVKPIREGSTVGLFICRTDDEWIEAHRVSSRDGRVCMIEPFLSGRELTVGVLGDEALPLIEIIPAHGVYDYEAKYTRHDTRYLVDPPLPAGRAETLRRDAVRLMRAIGARHLARVDFILDEAGDAWMLELNTMPGFTDHSLLPMAARAQPERSLDMTALCENLIRMALRDAAFQETAP